MITFKTGNTLFRVPKSGFNVAGTSFEEIFGVQTPPNEESEGTSEGLPIILDGISEIHFRGFLRGIYPSMAKSPWAYDELCGALFYATLWGFSELRRQTTDRLSPLLKDNSVYENILLSRKCQVGPWLINVYAGLILAKDSLDLVKLGEEGVDGATIGKLFHIREEIKALDSDTQLHRETVLKIKQMFAAELADMNVERSDAIKPTVINYATEQDGVGDILQEVPATAPTRKYVFVHFLVRYAHHYTVDTWLEDIKLAASQHVDGFILNVGSETWEEQRCLDCFAAADRLPSTTEFSLIFCFNFEFMPCKSAGDVQNLCDFLAANCKSPRMFRHPSNDHIVVTAHIFQRCIFGQRSLEDGLAYMKSELRKITPIYFCPSIFCDPAHLPRINAIDSASNWNAGWPKHISPRSPREDIVNAALDADQDYIRYLSESGRPYMATISPWYFSHDNTPKAWHRNLTYRADDWLFIRRWEQIISMRNSVDIVQILSWNDYGEGHYIGPINKPKPDLLRFVDGYPHISWLYLNRYFMKAFQTGTFPAITDKIFLWARPHPREASSTDPVSRPVYYELVDDTAWMVVFATAPAEVDTYTTDSDDSKVTFWVSAGMTKLSFPLKEDGGMRAVMRRKDTVVTECNPVAYRFESRPGFYNFNAYVAMSP